MELIRLKVNSQYRPCVDEAPYFSWVITSDEKNVMQTSYHITVKNMDEVMWDSGMVESDKSIFVEYSGKPLQSLSDYSWTVEVTVNNGEKAAASSSFETGFMKKEWTAEWVKSPFPMKKVKPGTGGQNPAEYFRKEFGVRDGIKRARVYATCHGAYQLSMNGMRPDDREFAPETDEAFTSAKRTYMSEYGKVRTEWSVEEGKFELKVEIPCNTTATVKMPDGRLYEVGSGTYEFECKE